MRSGGFECRLATKITTSHESHLPIFVTASGSALTSCVFVSCCVFCGEFQVKGLSHETHDEPRKPSADLRRGEFALR
jgi:hypothetical protein